MCTQCHVAIVVSNSLCVYWPYIEYVTKYISQKCNSFGTQPEFLMFCWFRRKSMQMQLRHFRVNMYKCSRLFHQLVSINRVFCHPSGLFSCSCTAAIKITISYTAEASTPSFTLLWVWVNKYLQAGVCKLPFKKLIEYNTINFTVDATRQKSSLKNSKYFVIEVHI